MGLEAAEAVRVSGAGCDGKRQYDTQGEADVAVVRLQALHNEPKRRARRLTSYSCRCCGYWHVGHRRRCDMPKAES